MLTVFRPERLLSFRSKCGLHETFSSIFFIFSEWRGCFPRRYRARLGGITRAQIAQAINATDSEDALKYLPSLLVRTRYFGAQYRTPNNADVNSYTHRSVSKSFTTALRVRYPVSKAVTAPLESRTRIPTNAGTSTSTPSAATWPS